MNSAFWKAAAERAVKTFAQAFVAFVIAAGATDLHFDWVNAASTAGLATLLSFLTSIASSGVGPSGSPSVVADPNAANVAPPL